MFRFSLVLLGVISQRCHEYRIIRHLTKLLLYVNGSAEGEGPRVLCIKGSANQQTPKETKQIPQGHATVAK
jgi:hypothetical protein